MSTWGDLSKHASGHVGSPSELQWWGKQGHLRELKKDFQPSCTRPFFRCASISPHASIVVTTNLTTATALRRSATKHSHPLQQPHGWPTGQLETLGVLQMTCSKNKPGHQAGGAVDRSYVLPMALESRIVVTLAATRLLLLSAAQLRVLQLDLELCSRLLADAEAGISTGATGHRLPSSNLDSLGVRANVTQGSMVAMPAKSIAGVLLRLCLPLLRTHQTSCLKQRMSNQGFRRTVVVVRSYSNHSAATDFMDGC